MRFQIEIEPAAGRQLKKLPPDVRARLIDRIRELADEPRPPGVSALKSNRRYRRLRAGEYRIVCTVDDMNKRVRIILAGHRRGVYKRLDHLDR